MIGCEELTVASIKLMRKGEDWGVSVNFDIRGCAKKYAAVARVQVGKGKIESRSKQFLSELNCRTNKYSEKRSERRRLEQIVRRNRKARMTMAVKHEQD